MNTSMPDAHPISITPNQVRALRAAGAGSLLVWHEPTDRVIITEPGAVPDEDMMVIVGHKALDDLVEMAEESGTPTDDAGLAVSLTNIAGDWHFEWPDVKAMTPSIIRIRQELANRDIYVNDAPTFRQRSLLQRRWLVDEYADAALPQFRVQVTIAYAHEDPVKIQILPADHRRVLRDLAIEVRSLDSHTAAAMIAAATHTVLERLASR